MRKLSSFIFLLLILMYLGTHASCYHTEASRNLSNEAEYIENAP